MEKYIQPVSNHYILWLLRITCLTIVRIKITTRNIGNIMNKPVIAHGLWIGYLLGHRRGRENTFKKLIYDLIVSKMSISLNRLSLKVCKRQGGIIAF